MCLKVGRIREYIWIANKLFERGKLVQDKLTCNDTQVDKNGIAHQDLERFILLQNKAHLEKFEEEIYGGDGKSHYEDRSAHYCTGKNNCPESSALYVAKTSTPVKTGLSFRLMSSPKT